ncbi:ribonuclease H-like protein [Mycena crocata]|nr:ribonuclease H-like protein [Mycena crocata]
MVESLEPKWNPLRKQPEDYEEEDRVASNTGNEEGVVVFDPKVTQEELADTFRIFAENDEVTSTIPPRTQMAPEPDEETVVVYTDGSALENGSDNVKAGSGIYYGKDDGRNMAIRVPDSLKPSNQTGEVLAAKEAAEYNPTDIPLHIKSDSRYLIDGVTKNLQRFEDEGFLTTPNGELLRTTVARLRGRTAKTSLEWLKGHTGNEGNEAADALAGRGARKAQQDIIDMRIPAKLTLPGAKLRVMTQSLAYKIIKSKKMNKPAYLKALNRRATRRNMAFAKGATASEEHGAPPESRIWSSIQHKDIPRNIRYFLWMLIHDGYKVGNHWTKIPGYEEQGKCRVCDETETMEHILTKCSARGQAMVWRQASKIWRRKTGTDLYPTLGEIMVCGMAQKGDKGTTRLYRILVSEAAFLIWKIRNERVIQQKNEASRQEIENRWMLSINNRLKFDRAQTDAAKYGSKSLKKSLVQETWTKVIENESYLPEDWMREAEVLVGVG